MRMNKLYKFFYFISLFINIGILIAILYILVIPKDIIILHYNVYFGIDYIGKSFKALSVPMIGFLVLGINVLSAVFLSKRLKKNLHLHFSILSFFVSLLLVLETLVLISVNI